MTFAAAAQSAWSGLQELSKVAKSLGRAENQLQNKFSNLVQNVIACVMHIVIIKLSAV